MQRSICTNLSLFIKRKKKLSPEHFCNIKHIGMPNLMIFFVKKKDQKGRERKIKRRMLKHIVKDKQLLERGQGWGEVVVCKRV